MKNNNQNKPAVRSSYLKSGALTLLAAAAAVAAAVILNLLVDALPSSITHFDTSVLQLYTISDETAEIVRGINQDVTVYLIAETGMEDVRLNELVNRYTSLNSHITFKTVDPVINPAFVTEFTEDELTMNSIIIKSDKRFAVIDSSKIFPVTPVLDETTSQYSYISSFNGEASLTSGLLYVTSEDVPAIFFLTGHGEKDFDETMLGYLQSDTYDLVSLSLLNVDAVPDDASCLICYWPTADISADESKMIANYIKRGGTFLLFTDYTTPELENLFALAGDYGMNYVPGLVFESNTDRYLSGYPYGLLPRINDSAVKSALASSNILVFLPYSHGIKLSDTPGITHTTLLTTSASAYAKAELPTDEASLTKSDTDEGGPFALAVDADSTIGGSFVWFSSGYIADADADSVVSGGNSTFLLTLLHNVCGTTESVSIAAKSMQVKGLTLTSTAQTIWSVLLCGIIPVAVLGAGLLIWVRRRKR